MSTLLVTLAMLIVGLCGSSPAAPEEVPTISAEKLERVRRDAEQGIAEAQSYLGACYDTGTGVTRDFSEAVKWYRKAANQGLSAAQLFLGECYVKGTGVQKDDAEAFKWYHKAAQQGYAAAQVMVGACYSQGIGVPKDNVTAYMWAALAATAGTHDAKELREEISKQMTNEQIAEAQRMIRQWKPTVQNSLFLPGEFKSAEGGFLVRTPATLKESTTTKKVVISSGGQSYDITTHIFSGKQGDVIYLVSYADFPEWIFKLGEPAAITEQLLNRSGLAAETLTNSKLLLETKITLGRYPGHEVLAECQEQGQKALMKVRNYIVNRRHYQVMTLVPKGKGEMIDTNAFLDSFQLLK